MGGEDDGVGGGTPLHFPLFAGLARWNFQNLDSTTHRIAMRQNELRDISISGTVVALYYPVVIDSNS